MERNCNFRFKESFLFLFGINHLIHNKFIVSKLKRRVK